MKARRRAAAGGVPIGDAGHGGIGAEGVAGPEVHNVIEAIDFDERGCLRGRRADQVEAYTGEIEGRGGRRSGNQDVDKRKVWSFDVAAVQVHDAAGYGDIPARGRGLPVVVERASIAAELDVRCRRLLINAIGDVVQDLGAVVVQVSSASMLF